MDHTLREMMGKKQCILCAMIGKAAVWKNKYGGIDEEPELNNFI